MGRLAVGKRPQASTFAAIGVCREPGEEQTMFAAGFFGLGLPEIVVIALGGFLCVAVVALAVVGVLLLTRRNSRGNDETALRREVARLQEEVDRLKSGTP
jgi:hypothetical protein